MKPNPAASVEAYIINKRRFMTAVVSEESDDSAAVQRCANIVREYVKAAKDRDQEALVEILEEIADDIESRGAIDEGE